MQRPAFGGARNHHCCAKLQHGPAGLRWPALRWPRHRVLPRHAAVQARRLDRRPEERLPHRLARPRLPRLPHGRRLLQVVPRPRPRRQGGPQRHRRGHGGDHRPQPRRRHGWHRHARPAHLRLQPGVHPLHLRPPSRRRQHVRVHVQLRARLLAPVPRGALQGHRAAPADALDGLPPHTARGLVQQGPNLAHGLRRHRRGPQLQRLPHHCDKHQRPLELPGPPHFQALWHRGDQRDRVRRGPAQGGLSRPSRPSCSAWTAFRL
mmetsp:Transcript_3645/g.15196  ORF Transcript_3645/g.15196 Transcript_3645/m.15196 type:complete len:263 (-) Transcript_3645:171-959(-)